MLGAGLGLLRGGPLGAVIGGVVQHFLAKKFKKITQGNFSEVKEQGLFVATLTAVLTKIALVKGPLIPEEIRVIHNFFTRNFGYTREDLKQIDRIIEETRRVNPSLEPLVSHYKRATQSRYTRLLLALSYQIALLGNSILPEAEGRIKSLGNLLGISYEEHDRIRRKYALPPMITPYTVLGLEPSASQEEIKRAYREMANRYHPDKVSHKGKDEVELAHDKFLEIQAAYQELEKLTGR